MTTAAKLPTGYTPEDFALLTEEEQAGLLEQAIDEEADRAAAAGDEGGEADQDTDTDTDTDTTVVADDGKGGATSAADDPDGEKAAPVAAAADTGVAEDVPAATARQAEENAAAPPAKASTSALPNWTAPADIDTQISAAKKEKRALFAKFEDGELTGAEYAEQEEAISDRIDALKETRMRAGIAEDTRKHTFVNRDVPSFLADHPEYVPGTGRYRELDRTLRELQAEASKTGQDPLAPQLIVDAHALVEKEWGPAPGAKVATKAKENPKDPKVPARPAAPPSLGGLPAADGEEAGIDGGEFAYLDRLQGQDYEDALAKLSPAQQEAYLQQ